MSRGRAAATLARHAAWTGGVKTGCVLPSGVAGDHCAVCADYEAKVMAAAPGAAPADVAPCPEYGMSDGFRAWLVQRMREEVFGDGSEEE